MKGLDSFGASSPMKDGPRSAEEKGFAGGTVVSFGEKAPMSKAPVPGVPKGFSSNLSSFGEKASLGKAPSKAVGPMSDRDLKQSK